MQFKSEKRTLDYGLSHVPLSVLFLQNFHGISKIVGENLMFIVFIHKASIYQSLIKNAEKSLLLL